MEGRRERRGQISPGEERGNETGKVAIAHGSVEFCEATPIGLADESSESRIELCVSESLPTWSVALRAWAFDALTLLRTM